MDPNLENPCMAPVLPIRPLDKFVSFTLHCASSFNCMNEHLAIGSGFIWVSVYA